MPVSVINPLDGDPLVVASIVANVTEKIRQTYESHEAGSLTNGALRHTSDQIDDNAITEVTTPLATALLGSGGVHSRLDMYAVVMSAIMGTTGSTYAAKYGNLSALTYPSINAINTQLTTNAVAAATTNSLVKRDSSGGAAFVALTAQSVSVTGTSATVTPFVIQGAPSQSNPYVNIHDSAAANVLLINADKTATFAGVITAPSFTGSVSVSSASGTLATSAFPAVGGDVNITAGSPSTSVVATVGGRSASAINTSVGATLAASATAVGNHGVIAKYDASGGMTFDAVVTAPSFSGPLTGNAATATTATTATNVAASGITGTIAGTQIDSTIARTANVPTNAGVGATGTWGIAISGTASNITGVLTAASFPALTGDVTTVAGALGTTVVTVGGYSAANVAAGATLANAATSANTVNAIVRRDVSGNFIAGTITATLTGTATNITGVLASTSFPAVSGDVSIPQGTLSATVNSVGGSSAANVHAAELLANAAASANTANAIVRRDASGNFTAGTITANVVGTATNVTGTVAVANGGTGQTAYSGYAILAANAGGTALAPISPGSAGQVLQIISGVPTWATTSNLVQNYSLPMSKLSDGAVIPDPSPPSPPNSMRVYVNAAKKFDGAGNAVQWSGGYIDLTSYVPGSGTSVWVMIYLNATAAVYVASGVASATPQKPQAVGGNTPLAYVLLYAGQINVAASDIYDWRTDFAAFAVGGGTGSGYSGVGHLHGQGQESFVATAALDELRSTTPNVAGMTVYVQPGKYSDTNSIVQNFTGGASTVIAKPIANPYYVAVGLSQAGSITLNYGAENAAPVKPAFLNATDIPVAYVLVRTGSTRTILNDDNVNALIYDARRPYTFASTAAAGIVSVSNGGTGSSSFSGAGFVYTPGGTTPLTYVPAVISATVGLGFNPTVTPAGANADLFQGGGGIVATGSTNIAGEVNGLHILASTKTGTGTIATFNGVKIEAQTIGTTNNTLNVVGNATISGNMTVGGGLTFNSNLVITAATAVVAQFNSNSAAGIVTVNNHASGATGLIESWRVNGVEQANMGPGGVLTAKGVVNTGNGSISGTLGVTGAITLSGGGSLSGTFSGAATFSGALTLSAAGAALTVTNNATIGGTLGVTGATTLAALAATSSAISGNETVGGTLGVTGVATLTVAPIFTALTGLLVGNGASAATAANLTSGSILIGAGTGAPTTLAATGANQFVVATGANTWAVQSAATARASIGLSYYDMSSARVGTPANNETVDIFIIPRAMTIGANFPTADGNYARAETASTGSTAFDVQRSAAGGAWASIGTITFSTAKVGTFTTVSGTSKALAADDRVKIIAPAALNGLTDLTFNLVGIY